MCILMRHEREILPQGIVRLREQKQSGEALSDTRRKIGSAQSAIRVIAEQLAEITYGVAHLRKDEVFLYLCNIAGRGVVLDRYLLPADICFFIVALKLATYERDQTDRVVGDPLREPLVAFAVN